MRFIGERLYSSHPRPACRKADEQRQKVIDRLLELLDHPAVKNGVVQHTLKPGWIWTYACTDLIQAGKALRADIDAASPTSP